MWDPYSIIHNILITEKSMEMKDINKYVFKVSPSASKIDIAKAVERIYNVEVKSVNLLNRKGKPKRVGRKSFKQGTKSDVRRAIVTLSQGTIEVL